MLTLNNIAHTLRGIGRLFYPHVCPICGGRIEGDRQAFCTSCLVDAPVTEFEQLADNPVARRIWNFIPIQRASSLLYFVGDGDLPAELLLFQHQHPVFRPGKVQCGGQSRRAAANNYDIV